MSEPLPDWEREFLERQAAEQAAADARRAKRRKRLGPVPARFGALATYNAERHRGLMHTAEYDAEMARLQCEFNEWAGLA